MNKSTDIESQNFGYCCIVLIICVLNKSYLVQFQYIQHQRLAVNPAQESYLRCNFNIQIETQPQASYYDIQFSREKLSTSTKSVLVTGDFLRSCHLDIFVSHFEKNMTGLYLPLPGRTHVYSWHCIQTYLLWEVFIPVQLLDISVCIPL